MKKSFSPLALNILILQIIFLFSCNLADVRDVNKIGNSKISYTSGESAPDSTVIKINLI
jgi:hypothetical protein